MIAIDGNQRANKVTLPEDFANEDGQQFPVDSGDAGRSPKEVVAELEDDLDLAAHDPPEVGEPTWIGIEELDAGWRAPTMAELEMERQMFGDSE